MKLKTKINLIKFSSFIYIPIIFFVVSCLYVFLGVDRMWGNMFDDGINTFGQWFSLIIYRVLIYVLSALFIMCIAPNKNGKKRDKFIVWLNWTFFVYLVIKFIIEVFAIDLILLKYNIILFSNVDSLAALLGYLLTWIKKEKIELGSSETIVNGKL